MEIGIVGGGIAGLAAAWLLQEHHQVTLFERQNRLGGHADTVEIEQDGEIALVDAGFEFFFDSMFPRFNRLLALIGVSTHRYPASATIYHVDNRRVRLLPPYNRERLVWRAFHPCAIADLLLLQWVIARSAQLIEAADPFLTLEDYLHTLRLPERFKANFLYPFLLAQWCVELEELRTFSAYNALKYTVMSRPTGFPPISYANEVVGGTRAYIAALEQKLTGTRLRLPADITSITKDGEQFVLQDANSGEYRFGHLIVATDARAAGRLLQDVKGTEARRAELSRIDYFPTTIAVHEDSRLMPADRACWSVVNTRYDGTHSSNTIWKKWKSRKPIFRSWTTYDSAPPDPLHLVRTYDHPKVNLNYYRAQRELQLHQGEGNLWLAGLYMHDIDCHESALVSAMNVAQRLDPTSGNLQSLAT